MKSEHTIPPLPVPRTTQPQSYIGRWLVSGQETKSPSGHHPTHPWYHVLWLTGVDYFSTLGYQPGIALLAAGALSPIATLILLMVTLGCALPVYSQVAKRSFVGQGSIAMLENLLSGWKSKVLVLILLGFVATDFVITMTLSAADATKHMIENPFLHDWLGDAVMLPTFALLAALAIVFLKGFKEAIHVAMWITLSFLAMNLVVLGRCLYEVVQHPEVLSQWHFSLHQQGDWFGWILAASLLFPKLALGLSGFETGVAVMPLVSGDSEASVSDVPVQRISNTRKLLTAAACIMCFYLMASSVVTTLLIPPAAYAEGGPAAGRALAYLAHEYLGAYFGSLYDLGTIAILWFAGASAMAGLLNIIPRYLPRFGMAPMWTTHRRPLVLLLFGISAWITYLFKADVEAQAGAYATGVLVLMLSAAVAVALALWREKRTTLSLYFWLVSVIFTFTLVDNILERPDGVLIASGFIVAIIGLGAMSRSQRSKELRVAETKLIDPASNKLWEAIAGKKVHLVPLRTNDRVARDRKLEELHKYYQVRGPVAFLHVNLADNRSEFLATLRIKVRQEQENYIITIYGAVAVANTIAYISELIDPISLFLGLTRNNLMTQALRYLIWGEGETGLMVYTILLRYWEWTPEDDVRPLIFLMSE